MQLQAKQPDRLEGLGIYADAARFSLRQLVLIVRAGRRAYWRAWDKREPSGFAEVLANDEMGDALSELDCSLTKAVSLLGVDICEVGVSWPTKALDRHGPVMMDAEVLADLCADEMNERRSEFTGVGECENCSRRGERNEITGRCEECSLAETER